MMIETVIVAFGGEMEPALHQSHTATPAAGPKTIRVTDTPTPPDTSRSWGSIAATVAAAFGVYFCMYAFRKPFTAASYATFDPLWGLDFKTVLVIAQVFGYCVSKFIGIRFIAEVAPHRRVQSLLLQIGLAELALLGFALTPAPWNAGFLFLNGLFLGMIFGLVIGFLEGRRNTEALLAALCTSFIIADGVVKDVGKWVMAQQVPEVWMPFATGLLFVPPLLICAGILKQTPPPTREDVAARSERTPMAAADRRRFLRQYGVGLGLIVFAYLLITILRSIRADFAPEIWSGLGVDIKDTVNTTLYSRSEIAVAAGILVLNGAMVLIRNNRTAFLAALGVSLLGVILVPATVQLLNAGSLPPFAFMVLLGFGLYLPYIAVHTTIFERFIAMTRERGTIGYLMYLADAFGYLGYVAVLVARNLYGTTDNILPFLLTLCTVIGIGCVLLLVPAWWYFRRLPPAQP